MSFAIITHESCIKHQVSDNHPELPGRLTAVLDELKASSLLKDTAILEGSFASLEQICRIHTKDYFDSVQPRMPKEGILFLDENTPVSSDSYEAAMAAAGTACRAVDLVMKNQYKRLFCAVRPPGHHALSDTSMGFCIFNNIAIAAAHALDAYGLKRVAIIDFDVHHGNGTQENFQGKDSRIFFVSLHENRLWPDNPEEMSYCDDRMMNIMMEPEASAEDYRNIIQTKVIPALDQLKPEMIFISAGFDSHLNDRLAPYSYYNDPPGKQRLENDDFKWITQQLIDCADRWSKGRLISILEGGYNIPVLAKAARAHVETLAKKSQVTQAA